MTNRRIVDKAMKHWRSHNPRASNDALMSARSAIAFAVRLTIKERRPKPRLGPRVSKFTEADRQEGIDKELDKMTADPDYDPWA